MSNWETVAPGVVGGVAGVATAWVTAWVTARGKVNAIKAEYESRIGTLEVERGYVLEDRNATAAAQREAAAGEQIVALRRAAANLVNALHKPSTMGRNVAAAQQKVAEAISMLEANGDLADLAQRLHQASVEPNLAEAEAVLQILNRKN
jgi:hypothetical protein